MLAPVAQKACRCCGRQFLPRTTLHTLCSPRCLLRESNAKEAADKAQFKERKEKAKSRAKWLAECQAVVNKYCRFRDMVAGKGCITCGKPHRQSFGGAADAGHFKSVGSSPHLRFYLPQIALQCVVCNRHQGGRALDFRKALIAARGIDWVEALDARNETAKFDVDYLRRLKTVMTKKARRMEKRYADMQG